MIRSGKQPSVTRLRAAVLCGHHDHARQKAGGSVQPSEPARRRNVPQTPRADRGCSEAPRSAVPAAGVDENTRRRDILGDGGGRMRIVIDRVERIEAFEAAHGRTRADAARIPRHEIERGTDRGREHVQRAAQLALAASRGEAGQLSIAILPPIGGLFLPPAIRAFRERFPVVDLNILDLPPQEQITALMDRRIDIGFVPLPVVEMNPALEFDPVREVELMVALPPGHRLARQRRLTLRKLAHEPFVMLKRSSAALLHDWVSNLCREAGFEVQIVKLADGPTSILELVSAGFGVALVPGVFQRFPSDVVFRPLPPTTPKLHLALSWRRDNESPLLKALLEILRTQFGKAGR